MIVTVGSYNRHSYARSDRSRLSRNAETPARERPIWRGRRTRREDVARALGYEEIVTPLAEHAELIERVGEDTDRSLKSSTLRGSRRRKLALRPEATAGVVRAYFEGHLNRSRSPFGFISSGRCSATTATKGRYRQFFQLDVEAIGRQVLSRRGGHRAGHHMAHELGLGEVRMDLNTIGDAKVRPAYLDLLRAYYRR